MIPIREIRAGMMLVRRSLVSMPQLTTLLRWDLGLGIQERMRSIQLSMPMEEFSRSMGDTMVLTLRQMPWVPLEVVVMGVMVERMIH